jgi:two-component system OmpR family sensor kinase
MSLRLRLVAGLVLLMVSGLTVFGVVTYELYSSSQYAQLRGELLSSVDGVCAALSHEAGLATPRGRKVSEQASPLGSGPIPSGRPGSYADPGRPGSYAGELVPGAAPAGVDGATPMVAPGVFGELLSGSGQVLASVDQADRPKVTKVLLNAASTRPKVVTTGSVHASTGWLVYISTPTPDGGHFVVALATTDVVSSLHRLVLIELTGAAVLLVALSAGAMLVLRRGLAPIEHMASTAGLIAAGELGKRAQVEDEHSEVGRLARALNTMLDEIEAAFAERDRTEERLRQFLADASHELRTPLTSIQGFAELSRLGASDPRLDNQTIMRRIEEESARMKALVEDLLLLARLDKVRAVEASPVDISVLAADACSDAIAMEPARRVTLKAPEPLMVAGDEAHLRQALANLASNALRYSPPGSPVEVSALRRGALAEVQVRDHGPGLSPEALEHAFDRFWQSDRARSGAGAGLGLSIVAAVVAEHQGSLSAANAPDGGAVFTICLPLLTSPPEASEASSQCREQYGPAAVR